jgi:type IV pilus assembly protein PilB
MDRFQGGHFVNLDDLLIPAEVISMVPASLVREQNLMPIAIADDFVIVAIDRPADHELIDKLQFVCNVRIRPVAARAHAIRSAIARYYGEGDPG